MKDRNTTITGCFMYFASYAGVMWALRWYKAISESFLGLEL